jgi:hypothetical protein
MCRLAVSGFALVAVLAGCSAPPTSSGSPSATGRVRSPGASPTPQQVGSVRTVLSPLGLNIHTTASKTAPIAGVAAQGTLLTVTDYRSGDGGWYESRGRASPAGSSPIPR